MEALEYDASIVSILYVEDEGNAREILGSILLRKYPATTLYLAENGAQGLELFKKHRPDIVITDISMPVMDGIRMSCEIKTLNPETVIIAVTAYSDTSYLLNAIEIGINNYVLKPIDYEKFFSLIDKCIAMIQLEIQVRLQNDHIRKLSRAVEQSQSMAIITDANGDIEYINPRFTELTGYALEDIAGQNPRILKSETMSQEVYEEIRQAIISGKK